MNFQGEVEYALFGDEVFEVTAERGEDTGLFLISIVLWRGLDITRQLRSNEIEDLQRSLYTTYSEPAPEPVPPPPPTDPNTVSVDWLK